MIYASKVIFVLLEQVLSYPQTFVQKVIFVQLALIALRHVLKVLIKIRGCKGSAKNAHLGRMVIEKVCKHLRALVIVLQDIIAP